MTDRVLTLHGRLRKLGLDAVLFNTSEILPSANLRYLTSFTGSDAAIIVTRTERHIFTDGRYKTQVRQEASEFKVHVVKRKLDAVARILKRCGIRRLGIEAPRVSHEFVGTLARKAPNVEIVSLSSKFLESLRICKNPQEKRNIQKAAEIASRSCRELLKSKLSTRKEADVAEELESRFRRNGGQGTAFDTLVASGARSALPHGKASEKVISSGDLVIIDFGCRFDGYNSDETVTCAVGRPSSEQKKIHQAVYTAHMKAIDSLKVGVKAREVDRIARLAIDKAGFGKYFIHALGHGVGLEVHEPPYLSPLGRQVIDEGMVFTVEPGIYVEGVGGVRLESLVYMDRTGPELLSRMPKDLITVG